MSQPTYSGATGYIGEKFVTLFFDSELDAGHPPAISDFVLEINGTSTPVSAVNVNSAEKSVNLKFAANALTDGGVILFSYTDPTGENDVNALQGKDGADAATFSFSASISGNRAALSAPAMPDLDSASDSATKGDHITNDNTPTVTGKAEAFAKVTLYDTNGTSKLGEDTADAAGNWAITSKNLADGSHTVKVTQANSADQTSVFSDGLTLNIDTRVSAPMTLALAAGSDSGTLGDGISNVVTPLITGVGEANASVTLYDNGLTVLGTATVNESGNWSITSSSLKNGVHSLSAKQTDTAGNVSLASSAISYTSDTKTPTNIALDVTSLAAASAINGAKIATLSATDSTAVTYEFATNNGTIDADNGKFTIDGTALKAAQNLSAGSYHIFLKATDTAGNSAFQLFEIVVTNAPSISSIVRAANALEVVKAADTSVQYTVNFSENVTGVDVSDFSLVSNSTASGTVTSVSGSGSTYTVKVDELKGDGELHLNLKASGTGIKNALDGDISGAYTSGEFFLLDHIAPSASVAPTMASGSDTGSSSKDAITINTAPIFTGVAEANSTVRLYDTDGSTSLGFATADGSGKWSIASSTLSEGSHTVKTKQTDMAGNDSLVSGSLNVIIDTTAPSAPATPTLASASVSGEGGKVITSVLTPIITGKAEANAIIKLYDTSGSTVLGTTIADGAGAWSITSSTLTVGAHSLTVKQSDLAGNVSLASSVLDLTIDSSVPSTPNQAPVLNGLSGNTQYIAVGEPFKLDQISISDPDSSELNVTLNVSNGKLNNVIDVDTSTAGIQLKGTIAQINAALAKASFVSESAGEASLSISMDDKSHTDPVVANLKFTVQVPQLVDGVQVTTIPTTLPDGGKGTSIQFSPVTSSRVDDTGLSSLADIPLATQNGSNLLTAHVPLGFGLTASGGGSQFAGISFTNLLTAIKASAHSNTELDQAHLSNSGQNFLMSLANKTPLLLETVKPTVAATATAPKQALQLNGNSSNDQHTALVIDGTDLPSKSAIDLHQVNFASVLGNLKITANTNDQMLIGDAGKQHFTVHSNGNSKVFAGGGNDTLQFGTSLGVQGARAVPTMAGTDSSTLLHGGSGQDTAIFGQAAAAYSVVQYDGYTSVRNIADPSQQVRLVNIEAVQFADRTLTLTHPDELSTVAGMYNSIFGRQPDLGGFGFWAGLRTANISLGDIALGMMRSEEATGKAIVFTGQGAHDVELLYHGIYNRAADAGGLNFWAHLVDSGTVSLPDVANAFLGAAEMSEHRLVASAWDFFV